MSSTDYFREKKQEMKALEMADPNTIQYGRSVWMSSLRNNHPVDNFPYKQSKLLFLCI